jgi:hypothetical protein
MPKKLKNKAFKNIFLSFVKVVFQNAINNISDKDAVLSVHPPGLLLCSYNQESDGINLPF